jgi:hypothetical protein
MRVVVTIPGLRLFNPNNRNTQLPMTRQLRNHWARERAETDLQKQHVRVALAGLGSDLKHELQAAPVVVVRITRVGGRQMDTAGLCACVKWVEDAVAEWLRPGLPAGKADDPKYGVRTVYPPSQESGGFAVRIELETVEGEA